MKLIKLVHRAQTTIKYQGNKNKFNQNKQKTFKFEKMFQTQEETNH